MDSDIIRREIERTTERIEDELELLELRARAAARAARRWAVLTATAASLFVVAVVVYRVRRRVSAPASPRLRLHRVGMPRGDAQARTSA
jgi:hypothetical protein